MRCTRRAIPPSAARPARAPSRPARTCAPAAGGGNRPSTRNAACTGAGAEMEHLVLAAVALVAAAVNGGLGYAFSSITVPVALLFPPPPLLTPRLALRRLSINRC